MRTREVDEDIINVVDNFYTELHGAVNFKQEIEGGG